MVFRADRFDPHERRRVDLADPIRGRLDADQGELEMLQRHQLGNRHQSDNAPGDLFCLCLLSARIAESSTFNTWRCYQFAQSERVSASQVWHLFPGVVTVLPYRHQQRYAWIYQVAAECLSRWG